MLLPVDCEKGQGVQLAKDHAIRGYPTYVLASAEGQTLDRWIGYAKAMFLENFADAMADLTPIEEKRARFDSQQSATVAAALGRYHQASGEPGEALRYYRAAQDLNRDPERSYAMAVFRNVARGIPDSTATLGDLKAAADAVLAWEATPPGDLLQVASTTLRVATRYGEASDAAPYLEAALRATAGSEDPQIQEHRREMLADHAVYVLADPDKATAYKKEAMGEGWLTDASTLNSFAWWCFENGINLDEAGDLAARGVDLAAEGREKAMILDTLAEIRCAQGDPHEALALIERAVAQDPDGEYYQRQLARLQELAVRP